MRALASSSVSAARLGVDIADVLGGAKRILGIIEGDSVPELFIPQLIELYRQGRFPFDRLIRFYRLDQINQAAKDSEAGVTIKPVLRVTSARASDRPPSRRRQ
jgi:aryl-alcohol dehydrogenase